METIRNPKEEYLNPFEKNKIETKIFDGSFHYNNLEIKIANNTDELAEALALTYEIYVNQNEYISKNKLTKAQLNRKMYWDKFDFSPNTIQLIGIENGEIVARARLNDKTTPLMENFSLKEYSEKPIREVSKLVHKLDHRKSLKTMLSIFNVIYNISKPFGQLFCTSFQHGSNMYEKMGSKIIGDFDNPNFPQDSKSLVHRWNLETLHLDFLNNPKASKRFIREMVMPIGGLKYAN
ncbi:MAG: hypothetical protein KC589_04845 [Nanoarchaeota archaeon]|nr:hypothetical protein [Nanoarchaeota archaeon]